jgi:hypothetical protein
LYNPKKAAALMGQPGCPRRNQLRGKIAENAPHSTRSKSANKSKKLRPEFPLTSSVRLKKFIVMARGIFKELQ